MLVSMPQEIALLAGLIIPPRIVVPQLPQFLVIIDEPARVLRVDFVYFSVGIMNMRIYLDIHDLFLFLHDFAKFN